MKKAVEPMPLTRPRLKGTAKQHGRRPDKVEHERKLVTGSLIATTTLAIYLDTAQGKFWQRRDTLRKEDPDYLRSVEHPAKTFAPVATKPAADSEYRTWTDASGQHKTEAAFSGMIGDQVKLLKKDGTKVALPIDKLSADDQAWIHKRSEAK